MSTHVYHQQQQQQQQYRQAQMDKENAMMLPSPMSSPLKPSPKHSRTPKPNRNSGEVPKQQQQTRTPLAQHVLSSSENLYYSIDPSKQIKLKPKSSRVLVFEDSSAEAQIQKQPQTPISHIQTPSHIQIPSHTQIPSQQNVTPGPSTTATTMQHKYQNQHQHSQHQQSHFSFNQSSKHQHELEVMIANLKLDNEHYRAESEQLKKELERQTLDFHSRYKQVCYHLHAKNQQMNLQIKRIDDYEERIEQYRSEREKIEKKVQKQMEFFRVNFMQFKELKEQNRKINEENQKLKSEIQDLQKEIQSAQLNDENKTVEHSSFSHVVSNNATNSNHSAPKKVPTKKSNPHQKNHNSSIEALHKELADIKEKYNTLKIGTQYLREERIHFEKQYDNATSKLAESEKRMDELEKEHLLKLSEINELRNQLDQMKRSDKEKQSIQQEFSSFRSNSSKQIQEYEQQVLRLKQDIELNMQQQRQEKQKHDEIILENSTLRKQITKMQSLINDFETVEQYQAQYCQQLSSATYKFQSAKQKWMQQLEAATVQIEQHSRLLKERDEEIETLQKQCDELKNKLSIIDQKYKTIESEHAEQTERYTRMFDSQKRDHEELKEFCEVERSTLNQQNEILRNEKEQAEQVLKEQEIKIGELRQLKQRNEQEITSLNRQINQKKGDYQKLEKDMQKTKANQDEMKQSFEQQLQLMARQLETRTREYQQRDLDYRAMEERANKLELKRQEYEEQIMQINSHANSSREEMSKELESRAAELQKMKQIYESDTCTLKATIERQIQGLKHCEDEVTGLKTECQELKKQTDGLNKELQDSRNEGQQYKERLNSQQHHFSQKMKEIGEQVMILKRQFEKTKEDNQRLKEMVMKLKGTESELEQAEKQIQKMKDIVQKVSKEKDELVVQCTSDKEQTDGQIRNMQLKLNQSQKYVEKLGAEVKILEKEKAELKLKMEILIMKRSSVHESYGSCSSDDNTNREQYIMDLEQKLSQLKNRFTGVSLENKRLLEEMDALKKHYLTYQQQTKQKILILQQQLQRSETELDILRSNTRNNIVLESQEYSEQKTYGQNEKDHHKDMECEDDVDNCCEQEDEDDDDDDDDEKEDGNEEEDGGNGSEEGQTEEDQQVPGDEKKN